jgi:hypothetical protein
MFTGSHDFYMPLPKYEWLTYRFWIKFFQTLKMFPSSFSSEIWEIVSILGKHLETDLRVNAEIIAN